MPGPRGMNGGAGMNGNNLPADVLVSGDTVGAVVRLAFHDAAGFNQNTQDDFGIDGCVDLNNPDNNGLQDAIELLNIIHAPWCDVISRADFWVLAGYVAVEISAPNGFTLPAFRYGRTTNDNCVDADGAVSRLPAASHGMEEIDRVFVTAMGLTRADAVALLGAHTLGRMETANSGFNGPWTNNPGVFNNEYYDTLVNDPWMPQNNAGNRQWVAGPRVMLNADMELQFNVVDADGNNIPGLGRCGPINNPGTCDVSDDFDNLAAQFANNQQQWLAAFSASWQRMVEVGYGTDDLAVVGSTRSQRSIRGRAI